MLGGEKWIDSGSVSKGELTGPLTDEVSGVKGKKKSEMTQSFHPE